MLFHSSIRKELARSFGATLVVLVTVVMTMTLIRTLGEASRGTFNPADVMIIMKPFKEWTNATSRAEMVEKMKEALEPLSERAEFNFSQPIQLRFNELMTGAKADIAVKLYGEDTHELYQRAKEAATYVEKVPGAADVIVEQTMGLPQLVVKYNRGKIARYGSCYH